MVCVCLKEAPRCGEERGGEEFETIQQLATEHQHSNQRKEEQVGGPEVGACCRLRSLRDACVAQPKQEEQQWDMKAGAL